MRKIFTLIIALFAMTQLKAQIIDTFDSNMLGWTEVVGKEGSAIITEGVMRLDSKISALTSTYAPIDPTKNFEMKATAVVKKFNYDGHFGLIVDYKDDYNYSCFCIQKKDKDAVVIYERWQDHVVVGRRMADFKIEGKKNVQFDFLLKSRFDELELVINNMSVIKIKYSPIRHSGIGFVAFNEQTIDFDNLEFIQ